ncbi:MAG TPA: biotin transporter BioY, partial [Candidatus Ornithocaccomicrobium faecavium]|nr:biotin transporter BioY [Candidatus Ornithocaccomicrobium faecavium]
VALGAIGLPVFAGLKGGIGMLAGATGGYLWTYPLLALGAGLGKNRWQRALFSLSGLAVLEIVGACQLAHFTGAPIWPYIAMFVPKDMIVVLLAVLPAEKMRRILKWEKF